MTEFDAIYFDGKTSARFAVRVSDLDRSLHIVGPHVNVEVPLADVSVAAPVANTGRVLNLPGGAQLQTDDHTALGALFPSANRLEGWVHGLERRWGYALAALVVTAGFAWWCIAYGLPVAATLAAAFVPANLEAKLGAETLATFDKGICGPSALDAGRQLDLRKGFGTLTAGLGDGYNYRLELRACGRVGPNAFALPGGAIVVTDDMVKLAQNDAQIYAVLAHEIGHVRHRHGLRMALQAAGLGALIATLAGDAVSITGMAVTLPTALLQSGYSRDFEDEADSYAFQRLKEVGLSPKYFAEILTLMEEHRYKDADSKKVYKKTADGDGALDYLSTHPATAGRIKRALANQ